jgi:predicted esterase
VVALSGYLLLQNKFREAVPAGANDATKVFMGHGEADPLVKFKWGEATAKFLKENGYDVTFKSYP